MQKYFIHNGKNQEGPFSVEELEEKKIKRDTPIWTEGMIDWKNAQDIESLKSLFVIPPPFIPEKSSSYTSSSQSDKPRIRKSKIILWVGALLIITIVIAIASNRDLTDQENGNLLYNEPVKQKTPEELRIELLSKEQDNPSEYLVHEGSWRKNLIGQTVLEGKISNMATLADFKDIILEVTWLTKTETELKTERYTIYEYVGAKKIVSYKIKVDAPSEMGNVRIGVYSATPVK